MKVLFTGGSSFTGYWFIKSLVTAGHDVTATFTKNSFDDYAGIRKERISLNLKNIQAEYGVKFGTHKFIELIKNNKFDIICHHGADTTNYKSADFDFISSLQSNVNNIPNVMEGLSAYNGKMLITGSFSEGFQGNDPEPQFAFSPYGLSKQLISEVIRYFAHAKGISLGKFIIPNPFGPYEEERLTTYLIKTWVKKETPAIQTPAYIRDNIHVSLLAETYTRFVENLHTGTVSFQEHRPSGYIESMEQFIIRFAEEMSLRLSIDTPLIFGKQNSFEEPVIRINTQSATLLAPEWSEQNAWDELAVYYKQKFNLPH